MNHALMTRGTPKIEVNKDHISRFLVFRVGAGRKMPTHIKTLPPEATPRDVEGFGGRIMVKAVASEASGRPAGTVLGATFYGEETFADLDLARLTVDFYGAWKAHKDAGFDASRGECERIAKTFGVEAPPFADQENEGSP